MITNHTDVARVRFMCHSVEEPNNATIGRGKKKTTTSELLDLFRAI